MRSQRPLLRKDFIVHEAMIYGAKVMGASAVLLIVSILTPAQLADYLQLVESLGMNALVEVHDEKEVEVALAARARIVGVNHRNLRTFSVDTTLAERFRTLVPSDVLYVAESGVTSVEDAVHQYQSGADAVLIGEALMRTKDKVGFLREIAKKTREEAV